jgi:hypothetical protein
VLFQIKTWYFVIVIYKYKTVFASLGLIGCNAMQKKSSLRYAIQVYGYTPMQTFGYAQVFGLERYIQVSKNHSMSGDSNRSILDLFLPHLYKKILLF